MNPPPRLLTQTFEDLVPFKLRGADRLRHQLQLVLVVTLHGGDTPLLGFELVDQLLFDVDLVRDRRELLLQRFCKHDVIECRSVAG